MTTCSGVFRRMRNKAAFHVDQGVIDKGLDVLLAHQLDVDLCQMEGPKSARTSLTLGLVAMHNGLGLEGYRQFLETVSMDHGVGATIQEAFVLAARSAGIAFGGK